MVDIVEQLPSIPPARGSPIEQWDTELVVFVSQVDRNQGLGGPSVIIFSPYRSPGGE